MATVPPDELLRLWSKENVTPEMAIGHLIQNLVQQHAMIVALQGTLSALRSHVDGITASVTGGAITRGKRKG